MSFLVVIGVVYYDLVVFLECIRVVLMFEIGEFCEVYYFCILIGFGVDVICLYLVIESIYR